MNRKKVLLAAAAAFLAANAFALIQPLTINFQGKLINPSTNNPQTGTVTLVLKIYNDPVLSGAANLLYTETQTNVALNNGVFSVEIGTVTALPRELFLGASAYLGVTVTAPADPGGEMVPRQRLVMAPYAFTANQLSDVGNVQIIADVTYATFTSAGNLVVAAGVVGSSASFVNGVTASSATFRQASSTWTILSSSGIAMLAGMLQVGSSAERVVYDSATMSAIGFSTNVIVDGFANLAGGLTASSATFTASGSGSFYALTVASGLAVQQGTLDVNAPGGITNSFGLVSATATFTLTGGTWTVVSSSGIAMLAGEFQLGSSGNRVIFDSATMSATAFSSNVVVDGFVTAASSGNAAAFFGDGANLKNVRPQVSTVSVANAAAAATATEIIVSTVQFTPTLTSTRVLLMGTVTLNRAANAASTWTIRVRSNSGAACSTASTQVDQAFLATVPTTAGNAETVSINVVHGPNSTTQQFYCLTAVQSGGVTQTAGPATFMAMGISP